ncbi:MAG: 4Fe-4S dicluster domain-containing protein [Acidimicrobiia bacterium]
MPSERRDESRTRSWILAGAAVGAATLGVTSLAPGALVLLGLALAICAVAAGGMALYRRRGHKRGRIGRHLSPQDVTTAPIDVGGLQRRATLKLLGLGALGAAPIALAPRLIDRVVGGAGPSDAVPVTGGATSDVAQRIRQWTMIIDLRYCDGCQGNGTAPQCTLACIEGHFAPEPMEWIQVFEGELAGGGTQFIPTPCQQCQNPPCVNVCPVGATFSTPEGTVLIDQERCIGCRICMAACPYDRRFFNWGDPPVPPEALLADYSPDHQVPAQRGTVMKCDFCPDMARAGTLPFCVQACPNDAIYYGDLEEDVATNGKGVRQVSRLLSETDAYRLKEHLGTEPRVFYVPGHGELVAGIPSAREGPTPNGPGSSERKGR